MLVPLADSWPKLLSVVFAINSSIHSEIELVAYSDQEHVSLNVGSSCMANASNRLVSTLLSGAVSCLAAQKWPECRPV